MRSKERVLKETSKLMSGKGWFEVVQILGLTAIEIALDFRDIYQKNSPDRGYVRK